jgi:membrane-bound inhibitor of C-type lysozyme
MPMTGRRSAALLTGLIVLAGCSAPPQQQAPAAGPANPPLPPVQAVPLDTRADGALPGSKAGAAGGGMPTDQTTPAQRAELEAAAAAAGLPPTPQTRTTFACDNDETVELRIFPEQGIGVLVRGGENVELQQEQVASGYKFSNGQTTVQGSGDTMTLNVGMMASASCKAAGG